MQTLIIKAGVSNKNNRCYSAECLRQAVEKSAREFSITASPKPLPTDPPEVPVGVATLELTPEGLAASYRFTDKKIVDGIEEGIYAIRTAGTGDVVDGQVENFVVTGLFVTSDPA